MDETLNQAIHNLIQVEGCFYNVNRIDLAHKARALLEEAEAALGDDEDEWADEEEDARERYEEHRDYERSSW